MSSYTVTIDPDTTLDSDGNGIYDDDFISSGSGISVGSTALIF